MNLICDATGDPQPSITLTRLSDNTIVNSSFIITGKQDEGAYRCTVDNGVGNAATADVFIIVQSKFISQVSIMFPVISVRWLNAFVLYVTFRYIKERMMTNVKLQNYHLSLHPSPQDAFDMNH